MKYNYLFLLSLIFLSGCSTIFMPADLRNFITSGTQDAAFCSQEEEHGFSCENFNLLDSKKLPLTDADKVNKVQDKWCVAYVIIEPAPGFEFIKFDLKYPVTIVLNKINNVWSEDKIQRGWVEYRDNGSTTTTNPTINPKNCSWAK